MNKYFFTTIILATLGSLQGIMNTRPIAEEKLTVLAARVVGNRAIDIYNSKLEEMLTLEDITPEEMHETAYKFMEGYLERLPKEIKTESVFCQMISVLRRVDIFTAHLLYLYDHSKVSLDEPSIFMNYYMSFCKKGQITLWLHLLNNPDTPQDLLFHIIDTIHDETLADIRLSLTPKLHKPLIARIKNRVMPLIEQTMGQDKLLIDFNPEAVQWADRLISNYKREHFITEFPPQELEEDILRYLLLVQAIQSIAKAKEMSKFLLTYLGKYRQAEFTRKLTFLNNHFKNAYPHAQELVGTAAQPFSPHAYMQDILNTAQLSSAADMISPLIPSNVAKAALIIKTYAQSQNDRLTLLMHIHPHQIISEDQKDHFFDALIGLFMPFFENLDEFEAFFINLQEVHRSMGVKKELRSMLKKHLDKINDQEKVKRMLQIIDKYSAKPTRKEPQAD